MKYTGTGQVVDADFLEVKWVGESKGGNAVEIKIKNAINMGNIEWTYAEKNDIVPNIEFTSCYNNTNEASSSTEETWEVYVNGSISQAADGIILGAGKLYVDNTLIALSRGGGTFTVEREYRNINADGDRGPVKGRVRMEGSVAKLSMNVLTILDSIQKLYTSIEASA